jgi:SAM-dependent methyltransferase
VARVKHMREFWDARASEDAYFFVDNRRAYRDCELDSFWQEGERDLNRLLAALDVQLQPADVAVEIGCGVGRLTRVIAARVARVYALDVSPAMIERARAHHSALESVEWIVGDGHSLAPLHDASTDLCLSHVVFQHLPDPRITLGYVAEMGRVLRPGGVAAFQISNDPRVHRPGRQARRAKLLGVVGRAPRGQRDPAWLGSAVELDELRETAAENGLVLERIVGEGTQFCLVRARRERG